MPASSGMPNMLSQFAQILSVLAILAFVLVLTYFTTRWIAGYQKGLQTGGNIELMEARGLSAGKYIQIVRIGKRYFALCVCKDTVSTLCELSEEDVGAFRKEERPTSFAALLSKYAKRTENAVSASEAEEKNT